VRELIGASMILLSGTGAGLSAVGELRDRERRAEDALKMTRRMRTEVCLRRQPIPEVTARLRGEFPHRFPNGASAQETPWDDSFAALWGRFISGFRASQAVEEALEDLGSDLFRGEDPERAFGLCLDRLEEEYRRISDRRKRNSGLCLGLGFAAGCALTILLI